jgi:hypothetical protein
MKSKTQMKCWACAGHAKCSVLAHELFEVRQHGLEQDGELEPAGALGNTALATGTIGDPPHFRFPLVGCWIVAGAEGPCQDTGSVDIGSYFARIGYQGPRAVSLETLNAIVSAHVRTIPFENLAVLLGETISLAMGLFRARHTWKTS